MKALAIYSFIFVFFSVNATAQVQQDRFFKKRLHQAEKQLKYENYQLALPIFQELWKLDSTNTQVNYGLGISLFVVELNKLKSINYFEKSAPDYPKAYYYLGILYRYQLKFKQSKQAFLNYKKHLIQVTEEYNALEHQLAMTENAEYAYGHSTGVVVENMGKNINSKYPDYAPVISSDEQSLYFTSRRPNLEHPERDPYGLPFEDIYISYKRKGKWEKADNMETPINSSIHDACLGFSKDGHTMYIYRTEPNLMSGDIYISVKQENGQWSEPVKYTEALNYPYSTEASLTITQDEQTIYFSSDRAGGYGGKDLYRITRLPNHHWSLPLNLGAWINTPYDEDAPFIAPDGQTLYFSSKGHNSLGDYDIYVTKMDSNGIWQQPENLGYPANTVFNDIFFVQSYSGEQSYFSSDRPGGFGAMDNYTIRFPNLKTDYVLLKGRVVRRDNSFIVNLSAVITVIDKETNKLQGIYRTNKQNGKYVLALLPHHYYKIIVELKGYYSFIANIDLRTSEQDLKNFKYIIMTPKSNE